MLCAAFFAASTVNKRHCPAKPVSPANKYAGDPGKINPHHSRRLSKRTIIGYIIFEDRSIGHDNDDQTTLPQPVHSV
jgi:hypothetical protein